MKLFAISDLHLDFSVNRKALATLPAMPDAGLITGGDLCTSLDHLRGAFDQLCPKYRQVFWVPGNHELWSSKSADGKMLRGEEKYHALVEICRQYGVLTPEDPFCRWMGREGEYVVAPLFIPYDYSFRPDHVPLEGAIEWAMESGVLCSDEKLIETAPYPDMIAWCKARFDYSMTRLAAENPQAPKILVNHFPFREDLVRIRRIPRFTIWCGTKLTQDLHTRFKIKTVISGHLHMRATDYREGVRFEEVSLGYPRDWDQAKGMAYYLREILPEPSNPPMGDDGPFWRFF